MTEQYLYSVKRAMSLTKCIPIKKPLIEKLCDEFPYFKFEGAHSSFYSFGRHASDGLYEHIIIQRDFNTSENRGALVITEAAVCYNRNWRGIPWFTVGTGTDIAVLITGKKQYPACTGWRYFENTKEGLAHALEQISADIQKYILPYFADCHIKLIQDKIMKTVNDYTTELFPKMSENEVVSFKNYLKTINITYSQWRKDRRKQDLTVHTKEDTDEYIDNETKNAFLEKCVDEIRLLLQLPGLKESVGKRIRMYFKLLFRDYFDFYNL